MRTLARIGDWSARHPWRVLGGWLVFAVAVVALAVIGGTKQLENGAVGESARGYSMIDRAQLWGYPREAVLIQGSGPIAGTPAARAAVADVVRRIQAVGGVSHLQAAGRGGEGGLVSRDGRSELVTFLVTGSIGVDSYRSAVAAAATRHPGLFIGETGDLSLDMARQHTVDSDLHRAELLAIPVTLAVLLLAFGAAVAAAVPVAVGLLAVIAALGLIGPVSQVFPVQDSVTTLVLLIGMAVGVDYSLFYLVRAREERARGSSPLAALDVAARTSGRTVVISGTTVIIAMAGIYLARASVFSALATGAILVVAMAVLASLTALPAVLALLGTRVDRGRLPLIGRRRASPESRFWPAVLERVLRRPLLSCVLATAFLVALALPALSLNLAKPSDNALVPQTLPAMHTLALARASFPAANEQVQAVIETPRPTGAAGVAAVAELERTALRLHLVEPPIGLAANRSRTAVVINLPLAGTGSDDVSLRAIAALRRDVLPATVGRLPGVQTAITGPPAEDVDFSAQMRDSLPYVITFVLVLAFVLLLLSFRSLVVPIKAIALNLLSVAASYGVLALVFQHRWAEGILGFQSNGTIIAWLPLFLFVILFGLSMDYHVFILSRVREAVDRGETTEAAVRHAIAVTAGVVTSAAAVMVGVFAIFGTLSSLDMKEAGVGLAVAILLDATVVRGVLLPAAMVLLGERNWYLPRSLERLPRLAHEDAGA